MVNLVFMGSPEFAVPSLDALVESERYRPGLVVSQPDRARGRGKHVTPTPVRARATELGIDTREMSRRNYTEVVGTIAELKPEVIVVVAFGIIIKSDLLDLPRHGCINVHASVLPRYRGVSPIQAALLNGDKTTGCTTMHIDEGIDTGDVLLTATLPIENDDTAGSLSEGLSQLGARLLIETLDGLQRGELEAHAQDESEATYTRKIKKSDGAIDWSQPAEVVDRQIRAMTPWPSAFSFLHNKRLIIRSVAPRDAITSTGTKPGTIVSVKPLTVACGAGAVEIVRLKPEGKKELPAAAYLAGHAVEVGDRLA